LYTLGLLPLQPSDWEDLVDEYKVKDWVIIGKGVRASNLMPN